MNTYDPNSFQQYNDSDKENSYAGPENWNNSGMRANRTNSVPGGRKPKKKNSARKKIAAFAAMTVLFGAVAGGSFYGAKAIADKVTGAEESSVTIGSTADSIEQKNNSGATEGQSGTVINRQEKGSIDIPNGLAGSAGESALEEGTEETLNEAETQSSGTIGSTSEANKKSSLTHAASNVSYNLTVADIAENTMPAMVAITNTSVEKVRNFFYGGMQDYESVSKGTGVIVGQNDKEILIATNAHVVNNADSISVTFVDEKTVEGEIKGSDTRNDLAVVAVQIADISADTLSKIKFVEIGDSDAAKVGEQVVAIGNALGYGQSVSSGYLSAKNRGIETVETQNGQPEEGQDETAGLLQTDAAINPGNSGGALLNMQGQLIGINSAKYAETSVEGMGFAIPINTAAPILENMMNRETRVKVSSENAAYFGITCLSVSEEAAQYYHIPEGVYVQEVVQGGAADKAGIKQGDIITAIDDQEITSDEELTGTLAYYAAGDKAVVTIARAGAGGKYEDVKVEITFDKRPQQ